MKKQDRRVEFRASENERLQIEAAAQFIGVNLSTFLRMTALERSSEILKQKDSLLLSNQDRDTFLNSLQNPHKPNKALKSALEGYRNYKEAPNDKDKRYFRSQLKCA